MLPFVSSMARPRERGGPGRSLASLRQSRLDRLTGSAAFDATLVARLRLHSSAFVCIRLHSSAFDPSGDWNRGFDIQTPECSAASYGPRRDRTSTPSRPRSPACSCADDRPPAVPLAARARVLQPPSEDAGRDVGRLRGRAESAQPAHDPADRPVDVGPALARREHALLVEARPSLRDGISQVSRVQVVQGGRYSLRCCQRDGLGRPVKHHLPGMSATLGVTRVRTAFHRARERGEPGRQSRCSSRRYNWRQVSMHGRLRAPHRAICAASERPANRRIERYGAAVVSLARVPPSCSSAG